MSRANWHARAEAVAVALRDLVDERRQQGVSIGSTVAIRSNEVAAAVKYHRAFDVTRVGRHYDQIVDRKLAAMRRGFSARYVDGRFWVSWGPRHV